MFLSKRTQFFFKKGSRILLKINNCREIRKNHCFPVVFFRFSCVFSKNFVNLHCKVSASYRVWQQRYDAHAHVPYIFYI